jgi:GDP-L-fucose synthase
MADFGSVCVLGASGFVGRVLCRRAEELGCRVLLRPSRAELDLLDGAAVRAYLEAHRPELLLLLAAVSGGIEDERARPAQYLFDNLQIQNNVIDGAMRARVGKVVFVSSASIYPQGSPQPIPESAMLSGPLDASHEFYSLAKIAGIKLLEAYGRQHGLSGFACVPTNLYGPGDSYDPRKSNVCASLLRRMHEAKEAGAPSVVVRGSGRATRDFLMVEDAADALLFLARRHQGALPVNVASGEEVSIAQLALAVQRAVGYTGQLLFDTALPDGLPRRVLDVTRLAALGWRPRYSLEEGLRATYEADFVNKS